VKAVAYDTPITGWRGVHVNTLRLWSARAMDPIDLEDFNRGDHVGALADRVRLEAISRVLYPSDDTPAGHELRLRQEIFLRERLAAGPAPPASPRSTANSRRCRTTRRSS
jgi:starch phosphorylase